MQPLSNMETGLGAPLVLCYHAVSPDWDSTLAVTPQRLRRQLASLVRQGYRGATFAQIARGEADGKTVAVTFDDGFRSVLEHGLPVLADLGLPATIFVPTDFVGRSGPMSWSGIDHWVGGAHEEELECLSWDELRKLSKAGWEVGSHTRSHPHLPGLNDTALADELSGSREICERQIGDARVTLAYPYGDYDGRVEAAAARAGYAAAVTMDVGRARPLAWPRVGVYPIDTPWRFRLKTSRTVGRFRASRTGQFLERTRR